MPTVKGVFAALGVLVLTLAAGGGLAIATEEAPCISCDVILLNEYPDYANRD